MMDQKLKQRLTGAIVLVALAVIFVPVILEGPDDEWTPLSHSIPEQPQMDYRASLELDLPEQTTVVEEPSESVITEALRLQKNAPPGSEQRPDEVKPAAIAKPVAVAPKQARVVAPVPAAPPKAAKATAAPIKGWFVQVGSFGQEMNASGLRDRLKSAGFDTRLQKIEIGKDHAYRVLVGPASSRSAAEKLAASLKSGQQLAGMVIEYP